MSELTEVERRGPIVASAVERSGATAAAVTFTLSVLLSSTLLFLIEPMFGRALLPAYGGSPAVWNTCIVGFQCLLLAGYAYAHWSPRILGPKRQLLFHLALIGVSVVLLPFSLPEMTHSLRWPWLSVLASMSVTIALPFAMLSSNSALVQRWFAGVTGRDPYPLYAASNGGSLAALLGYPLLFEPAFGLSSGWRIWAAAFCAFAAGTLLCALIVYRRTDSATHTEPAVKATPARRGGWLFRSAVGSSLLLSATMKITTDLGAVPLLWVLPLSLYLLTFVIAFSPRLKVPRWIVAAGAAVGVAWSLTVIIYNFALPVWLSVGGLLLAVFFGCLLCHQDLAASKPDPRLLTDFYLWIGVGGAVGGILNSIVAPLVFDSIAEFPITLLLLAILIHSDGGYLKKFSRQRLRTPGAYLPPIIATLALCLAVLMLAALRDSGGDAPMQEMAWRLLPLAVILQGLLLARHAGQLEIVAALLTALLLGPGLTSHRVVLQERSFFGTLRIVDTARERVMVHGTTVHGAQRHEPSLSNLPTRYYHPAGPFGQEVLREREASHVGIVGLGAGSLAAMGRQGDRVTFFEIDPLVERIARRHFEFLRDPAAATSVRIGDGRLLLRATPDRSFDVLIIDAFSSDAIPTHLLTREALDLYLRKVAEDGVVLLHVSNQHLDLTRVFRGWAASERRRVAVQGYVPTASEASQGAARTLAIAVAPADSTLAALVGGGKWQWLGPGRTVEWTDDRVDLLAVIGRIRI